MNPTTQTILRAVLKVGGSALATKGLTDTAGAEVAAGAMEAVIGGLVTLWGFVLGLKNAKKAKAAAAAAKPA